jgi:hypothetical protein
MPTILPSWFEANKLALYALGYINKAGSLTKKGLDYLTKKYAG